MGIRVKKKHLSVQAHHFGYHSKYFRLWFGAVRQAGRQATMTEVTHKLRLRHFALALPLGTLLATRLRSGCLAPYWYRTTRTLLATRRLPWVMGALLATCRIPDYLFLAPRCSVPRSVPGALLVWRAPRGHRVPGVSKARESVSF